MRVNGQVIEHISTPWRFLFAEPVFDNNDLIVAGRDGYRGDRLRDHHARSPDHFGKPSTIAAGAASTITLTGSGFTARGEGLHFGHTGRRTSTGRHREVPHAAHLR